MRRFLPQLAIAALAVVGLVSPATASPAKASLTTSTVGGKITRAEVLERSAFWVANPVPYSQTAYAPDQQGRLYRADCSGFVSMSLHADRSYSTRTIGQVAHKISKQDLRPGDFLNAYDWHVVLFVRWENTAHTKYLAREQTSAVGGTVERVLPYPHYTHQSDYVPMRYNLIAN